MNDKEFPTGPLYIFQWHVPQSQLQGWNLVMNPIPAEALAVPEVVEDLGDMSQARAVIDYIRSL